MGGTVLSSNYMTMEGPMVIPTFRLPDGDDPALGMTAMSPPNATFLARCVPTFVLQPELDLIGLFT